MLSFDLYLIIHADRSVNVYTSEEHFSQGVYSSIAKCHQLMLPWCIEHNKTIGAYHNRQMIPLRDDDDWVTFILSL